MQSMRGTKQAGLGPAQADTLRRRTGRDQSDDCPAYLPAFRRAQRRAECRHYWERVDLMAYEKHRRELLKDLTADPFVD